jgi:hypothetical protein
MAKLKTSARIILAAALAAAAAIMAAQANAQDRCGQLSAQLQAVDRGGATSPERAAQYRDAIDRQTVELDRTRDYARSIGCDVDPGGDDQCSALASNIRRMKRNLSGLEAQYARISENAGEQRRGERERILAMLDDLGCNGAPAAARPQRSAGLFEQLFGSDESAASYEPPPSVGDQSALEPAPGTAVGGANLRTICVRKCDGFFFPISFSTSSQSFASDEEACRHRCPAAEVELYAYNTYSERPDNAVSATSGRPLSELPNAFKFRTKYDESCSCKPAGQSWAQALGGGEEAPSAAEEALKRLDEADLSGDPPPAAKPKKGKAGTAGKTQDPAKPDAAAKVETTGKVDEPAVSGAGGPALVEGETVESTTADGTKKRLRVVGPNFTPKP